MSPIIHSNPGPLQSEATTDSFWPKLQTTLNKFTDLILPPICLNCQQPVATGNHICPQCWQDITFISSPYCAISGYPLPFDIGAGAISPAINQNKPLYHRARSVALYEGTMRTLIHKLKYQDRHELTELFTNWLLLSGIDLINECDLLIPVPLYRWRLWSRRFNQSALLANRLSQKCGKPWHNSILIRHKKTRQQVGLSEKQRRKNLQGAFRIALQHQPLIDNKTVLLIDDVITTGSTANTAASVLFRAGAAKVNLLTLACVLKV